MPACVYKYEYILTRVAGGEAGAERALPPERPPDQYSVAPTTRRVEMRLQHPHAHTSRGETAAVWLHYPLACGGSERGIDCGFSPRRFSVSSRGDWKNILFWQHYLSSNYGHSCTLILNNIDLALPTNLCMLPWILIFLSKHLRYFIKKLKLSNYPTFKLWSVNFINIICVNYHL